nr:Dyp-type peroxidase [Marinifaba aquimaris]
MINLHRCQQGILAESNLHSLYLMFNLKTEEVDEVKQQLACFQGMINEFSEEYSESELSAFIAIGALAWDNLFPNARPRELMAFPQFENAKYPVPDTPADLFVHIRSDRADVNHLVGTHVCELFADKVMLVEQVKGFRYLDGRDLTGFVDGTENPHGEHRRAVALVSREQDEVFAGGSYIHTQRYRHSMHMWNELPTKQQEDIVGRTKVENIEYKSADKPPCAHIKRANIKDEQGKSIEILRQSMPYGTMRHQGLFFISCANTPTAFNKMLERMVCVDEQGHYDQLLDYTQAETGAAFFAPSIDFLRQYL